MFLNADNEFECLRENLLELGVVLNTAAANEHCSFIERRSRWIKEKGRAVRHGFPYADSETDDCGIVIFCGPLVECLLVQEWSV